MNVTKCVVTERGHGKAYLVGVKVRPLLAPT